VCWSTLRFLYTGPADFANLSEKENMTDAVIYLRYNKICFNLNTVNITQSILSHDYKFKMVP